MKISIRLLAVIAAIAAAPAHAQEAPAEKGWYQSAKDNITQTWDEGKDELLVPIYTWHLPFAYTRKAINGYQNYPLGLGYGRGRIDAKGNYHGLYAMGFQDSHFKPEWLVGYLWKTYWQLGDELKGGLGFTAGITARADYNHYVPVPLIFPAGSLEYGRLSLEAAWVPGGKGNGNVVFFTTKWRFDANQ
jgi:palmitoyl transferase